MGHKSRCYVGHMEQMDDVPTRLLLPLEKSANMKCSEHLNVPNSVHFQIFSSWIQVDHPRTINYLKNTL